MKILGVDLTANYSSMAIKIDDDLNLDLDIDKWWKLYDRLVDWQIKFDEHKDTGINLSLIHI